MASAGDRYLPDLARCFAGEATVFSWEDAYQALTDHVQQLNSHLINILISSPKVKTLLEQEVPAFAPPSQQSKTQFETKIGTVDTTQPTNSTYDIKEIKADAIWLSSEVKIAEDEALRTVVLEWQRQSVERLLSGYSDAELASIQDALGAQDASTGQGLSPTFAKIDDAQFSSLKHRRLRLLQVYNQEHAALLAVSRQLLEITISKTSGSGHLTQFAQDFEHTQPTATGIANVVGAIESRLQALEDGRNWSLDVPEINDRWAASGIQCISTLLEILLLKLRLSYPVTTETLVRWLQMMAGCEFFANVQPGPSLLSRQVESLQALTSLTTLAMLDPAAALQTLSDTSAPINPSSSFFLDGDSAHDIHRILFSASEACIPPATPSSLAWALIMGEIKRQAVTSKEVRESGAVQRAIDQVATYDSATGRRTSSGSFQQSIHEEVMNSIMNTSDIPDPVTYLLRCTIEAANVFDTIASLTSKSKYRSTVIRALSLQILQDLLSVAVSSLGYTPEILSSQFAILASGSGLDSGLPDIDEEFIKNDFLMDNMFAVAAGRFPYESLPFLRMCRLLSSARVFDDQGTQYITFRLRTMDTFTQSAIGPFQSYHTVREDENLNLVALDVSANIFEGSQKRLLMHETITATSSIIPLNTLGEVISESVPPIIRWQHSYSGLAFLGAWLELYYFGQLPNFLSPYESADDVVAEVIAIISTLLQNTITDLPSGLGENNRSRLQDELLDEASSTLQSDCDVSDYIFEIFEQDLQGYRRRPSNSFNTAVLIACTNYAAVLSKVRPRQFWSLFSKSSLLESYGSDSFLLSIISGVEVPNQSFNFLHACTKLFESVIQTMCQQSRTDDTTSRSSRTKKFQPQTLRAHSKVLLSMTQSLYTAFEAIPGWIFASQDEQNRVVGLLASSFERIIAYSNAVEQLKSNSTSTFASASELLVQQMKLSIDDLSSTTSILRHLFQIEQSGRLQKKTLYNTEQSDALKAILSLSLTLVRLGKLRAEPSSTLHQQLFNAVPLLCRMFVHGIRKPTLDILRALLDIMAGAGPVSLLGHLGSNSAINFLDIMRLNIGRWTDKSLQSSVWKLLSRLVGRNQQWLAVVILTGSPPGKGRSNEKEQSFRHMRGKPFLEQALKDLVKIVELDPLVALPMLKFVINTQINWSWANEAVKSNKDFLPAVMSYVCNTHVDANDELKTSHRNKIAASVTDLATIYLHHAKASRDTTTLKTVLPLLRWLGGNAIGVASYKYSLHSNLRKNFASKFAGLELGDFKRTKLRSTSYGDGYYYDLAYANDVLKYEPQWVGNNQFRDQSFSAEFRRANLNLSLVDSEMRLLNSALNFCVEHSGYFVQERQVQKTIIEIVANCLDANTQTYPAEKLFENVSQIRADMAIALLQRLVDFKATSAEARILLKHAWECARFNNGSFEQAVTDNNLAYWRSMMTILLLTLQFQLNKSYMPPAADDSPAALLRHTENATSVILEIITVVIGQGFRSVSVSLQDQRQSGAPVESSSSETVSYKDIHLILTIFETILRMARLPEFVAEASQRLIAEGAVQSALLLYSWSHILTVPELENEPIYAEYALRFLVLLSSLPPVAEELAVEGVLSRLTSARITQKLQSVPDGAGHFDTRPHIQQFYNLWATGLLPICLNMLDSVGAPVASEVSVFLNQFGNQLNRASVAFIPSQSRSTNPDPITLASANEATTLALISFILGSFKDAGASAAVDSSSIRPLVGYDEHKKALSGDIQDVVSTTSESLKNKVVAMNDKQAALSRDSRGEGLVKAVVAELRSALSCLRQEDTEDDE